MNERMRIGMLEATRLTNAGKLQEATAAIQRVLRGMDMPGSARDTTDDASDAPIEGQYRVIYPSHFLPPQGVDVPAGRTSSGPTLRSRTSSRPHRRAHEWPASPVRPRTPNREPEGDVPGVGRFIPGSYTNQAGTRTYKLYIPSSYRGQALPLVVMLHGCTQTPDDFAAGTRLNQLAEKHDCLVVYPAQAPAANVTKCWNWFKTSDQQRDQGEPSIIAGITREIADTYTVDSRHIYVAGLSAGGAMAAIMGTRYPDLYAAVCIHSGPDHSAAHDMLSAFAAMHGGGATTARQQPGGAATGQQAVPTIVFHGDRDTTVHPSNGDKVKPQDVTPRTQGHPHSGSASKLRASVQQGQVQHGHRYTRTSYRVKDGQPAVEHWLIHGAGHAWSGGSPSGSYTDPKGPDASQEMLRFFFEHPQPQTPASAS